ACRVGLFLERRPGVPLPAHNLALVALGGALLGLLAGKGEPAQQMPQVAGAVLHATALCDQLANARQGTKLCGISAAQSSGHQTLGKFALLFGVQLSSWSRAA